MISSPRDELFDDLEPADLDALASLVDDLEPIVPSASARARLLDATHDGGRLHRFAGAIAALVDVTLDKAKELLDRLSDPSAWERELFPGLDAIWVDGGAAAAGCIRGFGRLGAGMSFPEHVHIGREEQLVLQGALMDSRGHIARPGETMVMEAGTRHSYWAAPGGPDLLFFVVVREGIDVGEHPLRHRD